MTIIDQSSGRNQGGNRSRFNQGEAQARRGEERAPEG